eukprot:TRINITY_DN9030_c0_g2_i1.p1 TRINITY_DN9030_c0_g2~~TRINITY_DN9030_c0_g2_i1.p1  ORF type:complete len:1473 (+),score=241.75 TRINITY_DN9030_c0_g2_i1:81-4499(+)
MAAFSQNLDMSASLVSLPEAVENALEELPDERPDELWPPPFWPGHCCKRSLLQLRDSSGLAAQQPPHSFSVRYDLRPITKQMGEKSAYLMLLDGESLRRIGRGSGLDTLSAARSWLARSALCAPPQLLARGLKGKLAGELIVEPDPHIYANSEGVLLMQVVLTADIRNVQFWEPAGDLISVRLGSPPIPCGLCNAIVPSRELFAHQQEGCPNTFSACPRCHKNVPLRSLVEHQVGLTDIPCVDTVSMAMQTEAKEIIDSGMQCVVPAYIDAGIQTTYQLPTPDKLRAEDQVASLVPSIALRWQAPPQELRRVCTEYRLSISEFRGDAKGGEQQWSHVRIELLEVDRLERIHHLRGELRHELDNLRPGTRYRLELKAQAPDGSVSPAAVVIVSTLSRLAGGEGLPADAVPDMVPRGAPAFSAPHAVAMRDMASQAGQGFIAGACKSDMFHDIGIQVYQPVSEEAGTQCNPVIARCQDASCGDEAPVRAEMGVQCKTTSVESSMQCEIRMSNGECQVQLPARLETGERMAGLELEAGAGKIGGKELLEYCGQGHFLIILIAFFGHIFGLTGIILADLLPEELWPCLSCPIIILLANSLELFLFEAFPTSKRTAAKLRAWRRKHGSLNMFIQVAALLVSSEALQFYRGATQGYGRRPIGILAQQGELDAKKEKEGGEDVEAGNKSKPRAVRPEAKHGAAPQMAAAPESVVPVEPCSTPASASPSRSPPPPPRSTRSTPSISRPETSGSAGTQPVPLGMDSQSTPLVPEGTMPAGPAGQGWDPSDAARRQEKFPIEEGGPPPSTTGFAHPPAVAGKAGPWPSAKKPPARVLSMRAPEKHIRDLRAALEDASLEDAKGTKCPVCRHVTAIPDRLDALRSVRFILYFSLPHLGISSWLLARQLQLGSASPSDTAATVVHVCTIVFHAIVLAALSNRWMQYMQRRWADSSRVTELSSELEPDERVVRLRWPGLENYVCDFWFVSLKSLDEKESLIVEMVQGSSPNSWGQRMSCLDLKHTIPGHYWVAVQPWMRNGGLGMPVAMGHCKIPTEKESAAALVVAAAHTRRVSTSEQARTSVLEGLPLPPGFVDKWKGELPDLCDATTDAKPWEVVDRGTDPKDVIQPTADAEVQNVAASVDASCQFPTVPKEYSDSSTTPEIESASAFLMGSNGSEIGSFDLPVTLHTLGQPSKEVCALPEKAKGLWLKWASHGLMEAAPRLVAHARRTGLAGSAPGQGGTAAGEPGARVVGDMTNSHQASFRHLEAGKYELVLSCELGACAGEVVRCPHDRCAEHFWTQDLDGHVGICQYRRLPCPLSDTSRVGAGCDWKGCVDEQEEHLIVCPCREIPCRNLHRGCIWRGQWQEEPAHYEKDCEVQFLINTASKVESILAERCPDYKNPEIREGVELLTSYSQYVQNGPWATWRSPGACYICGKYVDMKDKGLQREAGEVICWSDMCLQLDWNRMRAEEAEIEAINMHVA